MSKNDETSHALLNLVETFAISPQDARAAVKSHEAKLITKGYAPNSEELCDAIADRLIKRYAKLAATAGGITSFTSVVPGIGTILASTTGAIADAAASMKFQVDLCLCLVQLYDHTLSEDDARNLAFLLAAGGTLEKFGEQATINIASKAGVKILRQHLKGAALQTIKAFFRKLGVVFTRKALEKAIPFGIGAVIGSTFNYALTNYVGRTAKSALKI